MFRSPFRRWALVAAIALTSSLSMVTSSGASVPSLAPVAAAVPSQVGQWSAPFNIGGIAIHATLTRNGDVLFFQYVEGAPSVDHTSYVGTWNYLTGVVDEAPIPYHRDVFCAGNNVLPNGHVFISGGHDHTTGKKTDGVGVAETDTYNPLTRTWTPGPLLSQKRWYPTNVGMPNGKTLVFGGQARAGAASNTVDEYNPATNTMTQLASTATKPVGVYPRMHVLPSGKVLKVGPSRMSVVFNRATSTWANVSPMLFGSRRNGSSVLLPGAGEVMVAGGQSSPSAGPTRTVEILDTTAPSPTWRYTGSMTYARMHANTVLLPDGQVLVVGGGTQGTFTNPVKVPELYNPATGVWTALAPQQAGRMYHSTALLLPDGRVLSAGQNNGPLATYGEIYSPPYLFKGPRPTISGAPSSVGYGQQFTIASPDAADISSVTLIRAGSVTHQIDTDQRSIPLSFTAAGGTVTARAPANANLAPPGYYMLFVVNSNGVPSIAPWVQVQ